MAPRTLTVDGISVPKITGIAISVSFDIDLAEGEFHHYIAKRQKVNRISKNVKDGEVCAINVKRDVNGLIVTSR